MIRLILALCLLPLGLSAQTAIPCTTLARVDAIPEPWEEYSRTFANGEVRLAVIDTIEPAAGAFWLLILHPPRDELGGRICTMVGQGSLGFGGLDFAGLEADYSPSEGLIFRMPVQAFNPETGLFDTKRLRVTVNQSNGAVGATF